MESITCNADGNKRAHVLVLVIPLAGHFGAFLQLLYHIDSRCPGVKVTLVCPKSLTSQIFDLRSKGDLGNINLATQEIPGVIPTFEDPKFPIRASQISKQNFVETAEFRKKVLEKRGTSEAPTSIVCDMFLFWAQEFADELGIPCYTYFSISPVGTLTVLEHHKVVVAKVDPTKALGVDKEVLPAVVPNLVKAAGLFFIRVGDLPLARFQFPEFYPPLRKATLQMAGMLINSAEELDAAFGVNVALKEILGSTRLFFIGPSIQVPRFGKVYSNVSVDKVLPWLNLQGHKAVLYVSFGSIGTVPKSSILELAKGLEASGVPFLWALKCKSDELGDILPQGFEERTSSRGLIDTSWINQTQILRHPAVGGFLRHCGWNSLLESICSGVPCIAWPLAAAQMVNARYVDDAAKIGVAIASFKEQEKHSFDNVTGKDLARLSEKSCWTKIGTSLTRRSRICKNWPQKPSRLVVLLISTFKASFRLFLRDSFAHISQR